jgi:hypothetical protein
MATTKSKKGRNARSKQGTARKSATAKTNRDAEATNSTRSTGNASKQQSALERGGSLAQRLDSESRLSPAPDRPTEITSAAPPNVDNLDEPGRASSPSFDEKPVTGKDATGTKEGPKGQKIKAGEGDAGDEGKVPDIKSLEDLPAGSTVEFRADEVVIHMAVAGGTRRTFIGTGADNKTRVKVALAQYNDFAENGPQLFPGAAPAVTDEELKQFDKEALERSKADLEARGITAD